MAGNITESELQIIKLKAESMYADGQYKAELQTNSQAAQAVLANQTAKFSQLQESDKDRKVKVNWIKGCGMSVEDGTTNCVIEGNEVDTDGKDYELDVRKQVSFSVDRHKSRTNSYDPQEFQAFNLAKAMKLLDEWWAMYNIAKMKQFSGINVAPLQFSYDEDNLRTVIPAANYDRKLVAYLLQSAIKNQINAPYYVNSGSLYQDWINARFDSGNLDGKGDAARIDALNVYFDMWNFAGAGVEEDTFVIAKSAMGMYTRNRHSDTPTTLGGKIQQTLYTVQSKTLPGVKYDVFYSLDCKEVDGETHYVDSWRLQTEGVVLLNPEACPVTAKSGKIYKPTGVLAYINADNVD